MVRSLLAAPWSLATLRERSIATVEIGFSYNNLFLDVCMKQSVG
ncbi:hypothetical protein [Moorena sp. SIO4A1]|nr:hypothetical protein [Moorena sp. SIO4A1]